MNNRTVTSDSCNHDMRPAPPTRDGEAWRQCSKCGYSAPVETVTSKENNAEVLALVKRLRDGGSTQDRIDAADALERFVESNDERLSSGPIPSVASGPDGTDNDAGTHTHMTLDFALKIADSHAHVDDVLEYRALAALAAAVRAAQVHTADRCSSHETVSTQPRPSSEWHEDTGAVLWWHFPIVEPPYCGTPLDDDWPVDYHDSGEVDYCTHWTPIPLPAKPWPGAAQKALHGLEESDAPLAPKV